MTNQINEMFDASLVGNDVIDSIYSTSSQTLNDAMISSYDRVITFGIGKIVEGFKHSTVPHNDELHVFSKESVFCDKPNHCETNGISHPLSFQEAADRDANYQSTFYVSISHTIFSRIDPTTPDKLQYWINQEHQEDKIASRAKRIRTANNETLNWLLGTSNTEKEIDNDEPSKLYTKQFRTDDPSYQKKLQHCFDRCRMSDKDRIKFPFLVKSSVYPKILTFHLPIMSGSVACLGLSEETAASGFLCLSGKTRPMMRFPSSRFGANILSEKDKGVQCRSPHPIDKLRVSSSNITVTSVHEAEYSRSYLTTEIAYSKAKHSFLNVFRAFGIQDNQKIKEMIRFIAYHFFRQNKPIPWNYMEEILEWTFKFHERIDEVDRVESQESAWIYFGCLSESKEIKTEETDFEKAPEIHLTAEQVEQKANATLASSMKKQAKIKQKQERNLRYKQQNLTAAVQESPMEQQIRFGRYFTNKEILPHYGSDQRKDHLVWKSKAWHIARMAVHWMLYLLRDKMVRLPPHMTPYISPDSIDDIANKRIKLAWDPIINGTMKGTLKLVFGTCDQNANTGLNNGENLNMYNVFDVSDSKLDSDKAIMNSFNTGIFKPKTHLTFGGGGGGNDISQQAQQQQAQGNTGNNKLIKDKTGVTQTQNNNNPNSIWSQQQRIQGAVQQVGSGNSAVREIRDDLGVVDIIETPDNKACGVVKPHALYSRLSVDAMPTNKLVEVIHRKCRIYSLDEIFEDIESYYHGNENGDNRMIHVWLNGKCLGLCSAEDAEKLSKYMKKNRYLLMGEAFLSVVNDREQLSLELLTDAGRLVRPLFKAEYVPGLFQMIDNEPLYKKSTFNQLLRSGHVQYLDKAEENAEALIATDIDVLMKLFVKLGPEEYSKLPFTHAEIKSELMLGICSSQVIFAGHNQGPRNTFATAMIKQSIPAYTESRLEQMDGNFQLMHHVTTPLITVDTLDWLRAHDLTASGEMVMMANLCWLEKNIEDSLVLNAETIEKGTFRALQHSTITVVERKIGTGITQTELFTRPELENTLNIKTASYEFIDEDGLPFIGSKLTANHVSVGKVTPLDQPVDQYRFQDVSNLLPTKQSGYVTEVLVTSNLQGQKMTKLLLTKIAQASSGDKFSRSVSFLLSFY